jgi:hypothetical protein
MDTAVVGGDFFGAERLREKGRPGDRETGRQGDKETGRGGEGEKGRPFFTDYRLPITDYRYRVV